MKKSMYVSLFITTLLLGLMIAFQFRSNTGGVPTDRPRELTQELAQLDEEYKELQAEAADLQKSLNQMQTGGKYETMQKELYKVRMAAGMEPITAPGIEILLDNQPPDDRTGFDPELFSISYEDILRVVNELRAAGAKAIAINDQRLVATSEIRSAGRFIDVNLTRLNSPYTIKAIGDPEKLESSLIIKNGMVDTLKEWGIAVTITKKEELTVPAYLNSLEFSYAKPLEEGEK
ncbi:DUF881 domain-containing protein [Peptococcaceae bacterium 1198_IL3148]